MGLFVLIAFPLWCWKFQELLEADLPAEAESRLRFLLGALVLMGVVSAAMFFWLSAHLRKRLFSTFIIYNNEGITFRSGKREIVCRWENIKALKTQERGRTQTATVTTPQGRFAFDASLFNAHGPRPSLKMDLWGEKMIFPNGEVAPLRIRENELFGVLEKKAKMAK